MPSNSLLTQNHADPGQMRNELKVQLSEAEIAQPGVKPGAGVSGPAIVVGA